MACPKEIEINVRQAVVESQAGARCECPNCKQAYRVTVGGATPIPQDEDVAFVDAEGKEYRFPRKGEQK